MLKWLMGVLTLLEGLFLGFVFTQVFSISFRVGLFLLLIVICGHGFLSTVMDLKKNLRKEYKNEA